MEMDKDVSEVLIYEAAPGVPAVVVRLEGETLWLSQEQIAELFSRERSVVTKHLRNVFKEGELDEKSNVQILHIAGSDKPVRFYNLDVIISVGYRVNSKRGTQFRQWATQVLRAHLVQGFTLNQARLADRGLTEAQQSLDLLARTLSNQALVSDAGRDVLALIVGYAKTWSLLRQYDEDGLVLPSVCEPSRGAIDYDMALAAIAQLKAELMSRGEAGPLFGRERSEAFQGILGSIEQTMFGEPLYRSREEKAAHLLYFIIKDHPFSDGNKRVGSFMFLLYLQQENMEMSINANALTALALLIAESAPLNKDLMIRLVVNLLVAEVCVS
jgi:prophage maintenance system killer protein